LNRWSGKYRFWDQSAINFSLHREIDDLPEHWNRASWRFDAQQNNDLDCVLHYTTSARGLVEHALRGQVLFERFAVDAGLPVTRRSADFRKGDVEISCARDLHLSGTRISGSFRYFTNLGGKKRSVQVIEKRRGIGSTIFSTRRAGGDCTIDDAEEIQPYEVHIWPSRIPHEGAR